MRILFGPRYVARTDSFVLASFLDVRIGGRKTQSSCLITNHESRRNRLYRRAHIYFSLAFLVAVAGFFPSYFSVLAQTDAIHHFHGILASAWMICLIVQAWLISRGKTSLHRKIGKGSLLLAPTFALSGFLVIRVMLTNTDPFSREFASRLAFVDIATMVYFMVTYCLAISYRKNVSLHSRFMASTVVLILPPALTRLLATVVPGVDTFEAAFHGGYAIAELIVLALIFDDWRGVGFRVPYPILLVVLLVSHLSFLVTPKLPWWGRATTWLSQGLRN